MAWWLVFTLARAAEVSAPGSCLIVSPQSGDTLTVSEPCRVDDVPFEKGWSIETAFRGLPMRQGGAFSQFIVSRGGESFVITTLGSPGVEDVRTRQFKTMGDACVHRRRFTLTATSRPPAPAKTAK